MSADRIDMTAGLRMRDANGNIITPREDESDEEFCSRLFQGRKLECVRCRREIQWHGVCDACDEALKDEKRTQPKTVEDALLASGVPRKFVPYTWSGVIVPDGVSLAKLRAWSGHAPSLATIVGPTGTGKTGVAACLAKDWVTNGKGVKWETAEDMFEELRHLESEGGTFYPLQDIVGYRGLLVIDEIATLRVTDYSIEKLLQIIDSRDRNQLPLLMTSNRRPFPPVGEKKKDRKPRPTLRDYDERIASRVAGGLVVTWPGQDRRRFGKKAANENSWP